MTEYLKIKIQDLITDLMANEEMTGYLQAQEKNEEVEKMLSSHVETSYEIVKTLFEILDQEIKETKELKNRLEFYEKPVEDN